MNRIPFLATAIVALASSPAIAQGSDLVDQSATEFIFRSMSDRELLTELQENQDALFEDPCGRGQLISQELISRFPDTVSIRRLQLMFEAQCADEEGRPEDALRSWDALSGMTDRSMAGYGLHLATRAKDPDAVLKWFGRVADAGDLNREIVFPAADQLWEVDRFEEFRPLALGFTRAEWFGELELPLQRYFAFSALPSIAEGAENAAERERLLGYIDSVDQWIDFLALRIYEPLWPELESRANDGLRNIAGSRIAKARSAHAEAPSDPEILLQLVIALMDGSQFAEIDRIMQDWARDRETFAGIHEDEGWAINYWTNALDRLGRFEEASRHFDALVNDNREQPWVVSFAINRASRLVGMGRYEEGLVASGLAGEIAGESGTEFARLLVARDRICALHALGRGVEARSNEQFLFTAIHASPFHVAQAMMCAGERERAAQLLTARIEGGTSSERNFVLLYMLPSEFSSSYSPSILPHPSELLEEFPQLRAAFDQYARVPDMRFAPWSGANVVGSAD